MLDATLKRVTADGIRPAGESLEQDRKAAVEAIDAFTRQNRAAEALGVTLEGLVPVLVEIERRQPSADVTRTLPDVGQQFVRDVRPEFGWFTELLEWRSRPG